MNSDRLFNLPQLITLLLLSTLAFAFGYDFSYQQDQNRIVEMGQLAFFQFSYAEELKDDMAVIDFSKNIEKLDGLKCFQFKVNSTVVAEGGNQEFLTHPISDGIKYSFPFNWNYRATSNPDTQKTEDFLLIYTLWPGPLLWGLSLFIGVLFGGGVIMVFQTKNLTVGTPKIHATPLANASSKTSFEPTPCTNLSPIASQETPTNEKPFLLVDKALFILQVSIPAARLLDKDFNSLDKGHLFDLKPDSLLVQAIESAEEAKFLNPFADHPHISAFLKPDSKGCLIFLESQSESPNP